MNISKFQEINEKRAIRWHKEGETQWSLLEWCGAMAGEMGEACNIAKKLRRLDLQLPNKEKGIDNNKKIELENHLATEIADTIIYGLIILSKLKIDSSLIIAQVFDKKSIEYGFPERAENNE